MLPSTSSLPKVMRRKWALFGVRPTTEKRPAISPSLSAKLRSISALGTANRSFFSPTKTYFCSSCEVLRGSFFLTGLEDVCVSRPSSFLLETPLYIMHEVILGKYYPGNIFNLLPRRLPARGSCRMQIVRETLMSFECWVGKGLFLNFGSSEGKNMWLGKCHDGQRGILLMTQARLGHPSPFITEIQHILLIRSLA